ncbi:hypothetical protein AB0875_12670 [Micromonospora gifhornensis]|uniref:hypothetical protein n=1 Tax=Micromonospora gifhornensis TaxID=84594 RepID=UPI003453DDF2
MARIRTIKPEFFTSLTVASLPIEARLTFIGLWTHCDDEGRCVDDARLIKAAVWPLDDRLSTDVELDLKRLSESSLILRYRVGERSYLTVRGWSEHQRINRPTKSKLPPPPKDEGPHPAREDTPPPPAETPGQGTPDPPSHEPSPPPHTQLTEDSLAERNREQGTGKGTNPPSATRPGEDDAVEGEIVDTPRALALVTTDEPENAGHITKQWIDHCTANQVKLTKNHIKRYAAGIKGALDQNFQPALIKTALGQMLTDRVASRPHLLDTYLVRAQQGPELPPRRATRTEASIARNGTSSNAALIRDALTRPA